MAMRNRYNKTSKTEKYRNEADIVVDFKENKRVSINKFLTTKVIRGRRKHLLISEVFSSCLLTS